MIGYVSKNGSTLVLSQDGFQYCVDIGNTILKLHGEPVDVKAYVQRDIPDNDARDLVERIDRLQNDAYSRTRCIASCDIFHRARNAITGHHD